MLFNINDNHRPRFFLEAEDDVTDYTTAAEDDATAEAGTDDTGAEEQTTPTEDNTPEEAPEDYTVPDEDDNPADDTPVDDEGGDTGDDPGMDEGGDDPTADDTGEDDYSTDDGSSSEGDNEIKQLQDEILSSLSPEQMAVKDTELRQRYFRMYQNISDIIEKINDMTKTEDSISMIEFISTKLDEMISMLDTYIGYTYDTKTYVENEINFVKFLGTLRGIDKVLANYRNKIESEKK